MADWNLIVIGITLITAGIVLGLLASSRQPGTERREHRVKGGAIVIVGPFPIVFGSDSSVTKALLVLAIILVVLLIGFYLLQIM